MSEVAHPTQPAPGLRLLENGLGGLPWLLPLAGEDSVKVKVSLFWWESAFSRLKAGCL
jgi:hypothetical protein